MTIEKGQPWGRSVARPPHLRLVADDAALTAALTDTARPPVGPSGGDLHRTLGGRDLSAATEVLELSIDLLRLRLDNGPELTACAHVLVESPWWRGGWWRGDVLMVMNAEFVGDWHVVSRGHPNDGRAESCSWSNDFTIRQRWQARRRLPGNRHVPHPEIKTRAFRHRSWEFDRPARVRVDGRPAGLARRLDVRVEADAATIYA